MLRSKSTFLLILLFAIFLSACAPDAKYNPSPASPLVPGTEIPQQMATVTSDSLTGAAIPAVTSTPTIGGIDSSQTLSSSELKPPDSDTPAAGICASATGDPATVILGSDASGMPLAGRCMVIDPAQRIKLLNQSPNPLNMNFAGYQIDLSVGGEILLDKPVGQYLALGVHLLPIGPELWVKSTENDAPVFTAPPPIVMYSNPVAGYNLGLPGDWQIDESGMTNITNKEVIFSPPYAEPFITYLSISLDSRTIDQIVDFYAQNVPDAAREDTIFNDYTAIKYTLASGRNEYFVPYGNRIFSIATDRPDDGIVKAILRTVKITVSSSNDYQLTMMDNGKTFNMKVGDNIRLNLDSGYEWFVMVDNPAVLAGSLGVYQVLASGTASLTANGDPECRNSTPSCLSPSILFRIVVIV